MELLSKSKRRNWSTYICECTKRKTSRDQIWIGYGIYHIRIAKHRCEYGYEYGIRISLCKEKHIHIRQNWIPK